MVFFPAEDTPTDKVAAGKNTILLPSVESAQNYEQFKDGYSGGPGKGI
jgi:hypothetical protein